jgi:flagellar M-ring protein FliF
VPPLSETTSKETYAGGGAAASGVLGPDNIQVPSGGDGGDGSYTKESATSNNAVNKVTEHTTSAPGAVKRQSVAVVLDTGAAQALDMTRLTEMVGAAAGIDSERGDTLSVARMKFDTAAADRAAQDLAASKEAAQHEQTMDLIRTGAIAAAVLLVLVVAFLLSRRGRRRGVEPIDIQHLEVVRTHEALAGIDSDALEGARKPALPPAPRQPADSLSAMRNEVTELVERQPDEVAELLRGWLADRRS